MNSEISGQNLVSSARKLEWSFSTEMIQIFGHINKQMGQQKLNQDPPMPMSDPDQNPVEMLKIREHQRGFWTLDGLCKCSKNQPKNLKVYQEAHWLNLKTRLFPLDLKL
ncbi:hypothetical protein ILYODFUR_032191 [Ilyodon furcidens]|uniref:Uncharacterized protein n=1 Tax=Ilyodon furcidens TaxID=33524 RepID=A0ABV0UKT6_9TELE